MRTSPASTTTGTQVQAPRPTWSWSSSTGRRSPSASAMARCLCRQALDVIAQAATGLDAAHTAGLVHRDIKPANLLLSPAGTLKITDFGISHALGSVPLTGTGMVMGTSGYLAPERSAGAGATAASDIYALGVVGYECLTGAPPFDGGPLEQALAHRERPLPPLPASVPADVAAFIAELTAKDPATRPPSAAAVARRARQLRDGLSAGLPMTSVAPRAGRAASRACAGASWPAGLPPDPDPAAAGAAAIPRATARRTAAAAAAGTASPHRRHRPVPGGGARCSDAGQHRPVGSRQAGPDLAHARRIRIRSRSSRRCCSRAARPSPGITSRSPIRHRPIGRARHLRTGTATRRVRSPAAATATHSNGSGQ